MIRVVASLALCSALLWAASVKLYLTDGTFHQVREYQVLEDRVRFYTLERSQWEEVPLDLIDLERTKREAEELKVARDEEYASWESEEQADRARRREISRVPMETGVYLVDGEQMRKLGQAELDVKSDKKKKILKTISPIPMISGKKRVQIPGEYSEWQVDTPTPEFYIRLFREERFGIVQLTTRKGSRVVEEWAIAPVTNMVYEDHEDIGVFKRQAGDNLYKIWPKTPLEPGEYAVIEFSTGEANIQAWDFGYWPGGRPPLSEQSGSAEKAQ